MARTEDTDGGPLISVGPPCVLADDVLAHRVYLGSGVHLGIDLMAPCTWRGLTFRAPGDTARPLLTRLLGSRAADTVIAEDVGRSGGPGGTVAVDTLDAIPWLRFAVVDAVDRWLQLPLDQSLVDAERGVSRMRAAAGLPDGPLRCGLVAESLVLARRASRGLVRYLSDLAVDGVAAPALRRALRHLVDGYRCLLREVGDLDDELMNVVDEWSRLDEYREQPDAPRTLVVPPSTPVGHVPGCSASMIDPRQSRARTFAMSHDPAAAEVSVVSVGRRDPGTVVVQAPAFGTRVAPEVLCRLMVRLVDRRSGSLGGYALLSSARRPARSGGAAFLEALVPLCGLERADVRADLFDVLVVRPPASDDGDAALRRARRSVVVLGEWRRLLGLALMPVPPEESAPLLREPLRALVAGATGADPDPICTGAPSERQLHGIDSMDDETLVRWVRTGGRPDGARSAHDTGELTVAELAAANASLVV